MGGNSSLGLHDQLIFELLKAIDKLNEKTAPTEFNPRPMHCFESNLMQKNCEALLKDIKKIEDAYTQLLDIISNMWDELSTLNTKLAIMEQSIKNIYSEISLAYPTLQ
jgi:primosomal protein N''